MAGTTHRRVLSGLELVTAATYAEKGNRKKISRNVKNSGADTPTTTSCKETKKDSYFKYMQRHALPYFTAYLPWGAVGNILEWKCGTDMSVRSKDETPEILWGLPADSAPSKHKKEVQKGFLSHIENWFLSLSHFLSSSKWSDDKTMVTNIRGLFCNRHLVHLPKPCQSRYQRRSLNEEACTYLPRGFFFPTSVAYACSDVHLKGNTCLDKVHPKTFSSCKRHHTNNLKREKKQLRVDEMRGLVEFEGVR
ncbi:hypothetical protein RUM44_010512 [Polyplax serrata]|uniref:Uncharacterized protein n=1 Tax=Polyplax serrata TaxID=468196 RepID=A0ABR1AVQ8_POLSC